MSSSNSSSPKIFDVAVEEKRTMNNPKQGSPQEVVPERTTTEVVFERTITERPCFGLGVVRPEKDIMKKHPQNDTITQFCKICYRGFSAGRALRTHQNSHKLNREVERQLKKMEPSFSMKPSNSYQGTSTTTFPSFTSTFPPFTRGTTDMDMVVGHHVSPYRSLKGNTSHGFLSLTHNYNHHTLSNANHLARSFGPFKSKGVGSNNVYSSLYNGGTSGGNTITNMTMVPPATEYRPFTENTSYASSSRYPLPSYNDSQLALSLELSLGPDHPIGSSSNNNNSKTLELSLGPSKTIGGGNTNKKVITDLNMPVGPRVSRYQFNGHNPLDSITRNVPLSVSPPSPTINLFNDENVSGSSYSEMTILKGKTKIGVLQNDDNDKGVIDEVHDEDQPEEVDTKSWGRDLSYFL